MFKANITLPLIFEQFKKEGKELIWSIIILNGFGDFEKGDYLDNVVNEIIRTRGESRFFLSWDEIYEMSKKFSDIIDLVIVGCESKKNILELDELFVDLASKGYPNASQLPPLYQIMIDIDDGLLKGIYSRNEKIHKKCKDIFGPYPAAIYQMANV